VDSIPRELFYFSLSKNSVRSEESLPIDLYVSDGGGSLGLDSKEANSFSPEEEEKELIRRIQSGQKDEFRHLVTRYKSLVYSMVMRQVSHTSVAEELTQEVFVKSYLHIKKFRLESKFSTWLTRIALNHTNTYFSSKRFKTERVSESFDIQKHEVHVKKDNHDAEHEERQEELFGKFKAALAKLKPIFREVLVLCALEGKTYEEVSDILEIPIGTVRSRLNKARLLMRRVVEEVG